MNEATKKEVAILTKQAVEKAGSLAKWGNKHEISVATLSNIVNGKWGNIADKMWARVAAAVRYQGMEWQVAPTSNYKFVTECCRLAQADSLSMAMSFDAGTGKTASLLSYAGTNENVVYLQCAEYWTKRGFLANLYRALGKDPDQLTAPDIADGIISELRQRHRPLLILDEVDKLRDPLLLFFIELYNKLDGLCGFFLVGAPYLRIAWEKNAKRDKRGFREIYSRIGRRFLPLNPLRKKDVDAICSANGVTDADEMVHVWNAVEREPDLRRVKREVERLRLQKLQLVA